MQTDAWLLCHAPKRSNQVLCESNTVHGPLWWIVSLRKEIQKLNGRSLLSQQHRWQELQERRDSNTVRHHQTCRGSSLETELMAMFCNTHEAIPLKLILEELGHIQTVPTPMTVDNNTAHGLTKGSMVPWCSKPMDMHFSWLKCRESQHQFNYLLQPGKSNRANYHTKHFPAQQHIQERKIYLVNCIAELSIPLIYTICNIETVLSKDFKRKQHHQSFQLNWEGVLNMPILTHIRSLWANSSNGDPHANSMWAVSNTAQWEWLDSFLHVQTL